MLLLANSTLPAVTPLVLPFVADAPGGVDGSWPAGTVQTVTLLGGGESGAEHAAGSLVVPHGWNDAEGLEIHTNARGAVSQPYVAVFQLDFA